MVRLDLPGYQRLSKPKGGIDDRFAQLSRHWVGGEQHARDLALHHLLYDHRQGSFVVVYSITGAVANSARCPQAAPAFDDCLEQVVLTGDV